MTLFCTKRKELDLQTRRGVIPISCHSRWSPGIEEKVTLRKAEMNNWRIKVNNYAAKTHIY
jgi:hypothetical protein